jgi:hypothetical protein
MWLQEHLETTELSGGVILPGVAPDGTPNQLELMLTSTQTRGWARAPNKARL